MRFVILVKATPQSEAGTLPSPEHLAEMGKFNQTLLADGVMLAAEGLQASSKGARLAFSGGKATVTDGPFAESKELIAGFWIVQGKSKAELVERFSHAPMDDGMQIEIRPVYELEDFGDNVPAEVADQERRTREARA
jgi:hypothetical protein